MKKKSIFDNVLIASAVLVAHGMNTISAQNSSLWLNSNNEGDKISLFGDRLQEINMYGFGVRSSTLYNKSAGAYAWLIGSNTFSGENQADIFGKSSMFFSKDANGPVLTIREHSANQSSQSGEIRFLEKDYNATTGSIYGGFIGYNGSSNEMTLGTYDGLIKRHAISVKRSNGFVGIGTTNPNQILVLEENDPVLSIRDAADNNSAQAARIELLEYASGTFNGGAYMRWDGAKNQFLLGTKLDGTDNDLFVLSRTNQCVGIGTTSNSALSSNFKLHVNGKIRAKEIVVETGWADYVFEPNYKLASLEEVEKFIKKNKHLPDVLPAAAVEQHGVSVGEMEATLLRKIEELTLYMIQLKKQNDLLQQQINQLTH